MRRRRLRERHLKFERLEARTLLAGDVSPLVSFRLAALDIDTLEPLDTIHQGRPFLLAMYAQDLRSEADGVYGAYADIQYPADAFDLIPLPRGESLFHSLEFPNGLSGDISVLGIVDELGGFVADTTPPGAGEQLVAGVPLVPTGTGNVTFTIDPADELPFHQVLLFNEELAVAENRQQFTALTLDVQAPLPVTAIDAIADAYSVAAGSENNRFEVLANDRNDTGRTLLITAVDTRRLRGSVRIVERGRSLFYTPADGFYGEERFTYTAVADGKQDVTSVLVRVERDEPRLETAAFHVELSDAVGEPLAAVHVGEEFLVRVYSEDLRADPQGVFGAYLDLEYSATNVEVAGPLAFGPDYQNGQAGTTYGPGLIDEAGAFARLDPISGGRVPLFSVLFRATQAGAVTFRSSPADGSPEHQVLVFDRDDALPLAEVFYGRASLEILPNVIALDDSFDLQAAEGELLLPVLANDLNLKTDTLRVTAFSAAGLSGQVRILENGQGIGYAPPLGFSGSEQFTYTATSGAESNSGTVTVHVIPAANLDDVVAIHLRTTDLAGEAITDIQPGESFLVQVLAQDLRGIGTDRGVYAAYLDLLYDREVVHAVRQVSDPAELAFQFGPGYQNGISSRSLVAGILDEVGAFQTSTNPLGSAEQLLFAVQFRARSAAGTADSYSITEDADTVLDVRTNDNGSTAPSIAEFRSDTSDDRPHSDVLLYDPPEAVPFENIRFGRATVNVLEGGESVIATVGRPNHGGHVEITPDGKQVKYRPAEDFTGVETFFYTLDGETRIAVSVDVIPVNDAPVAYADSYTMDVNHILHVDAAHGVLANDLDAEGSAVPTSLVSAPEHGALIFRRDGSFQYTPTVGFSGVDRFSYRISDGELASEVTTVDITVVAQPVSIRLRALDLLGEPILAATAGESLVVQALVQDRRIGAIRPGLGAVYMDVEFDSTLVHPKAGNSGASVKIEFGANYQNATRGDAIIPGRLNDVGGLQTIVEEPLGTAEIELFRVTFEQHGPRSFDDRFAVVQDGQGSILRVLRNEMAARWFIGFIAAPAHHSPHADVVYYEPAEVVPTADINFTHTVVAVRNGALTLHSVSQSVRNGILSIDQANGTITYTPPPDFIGEDSFTYTVLDSLGRAASATVTVEVTATWQNPVESLDSNADGEVSPVDVLLVINDLNTLGSRPISSVPATTAFLDVSGDGFVSPLDVLLIINRLIVQAVGEGEAPPDADLLASTTGFREERPQSANNPLADHQSPRNSPRLRVPELVMPGPTSAPSFLGSITASKRRQFEAIVDELAADVFHSSKSWKPT